MNQLACEVQVSNPIAISPSSARDFHKLTQELKKFFPQGKLHFYGSHVMGVATHDSDVDIFIELGNKFLCLNNFYVQIKVSSSLEKSYYKPMQRERAQDYIKILTQKIQENPSTWRLEFKTLTGRVPCVHAFFKPHNVYCDITFTSGLGVENSKLIRHLFKIQPEAAKLSIYMKKWLKSNGVIMKGYNVILLTVFYLQVKDFLPSVGYLQALASYSKGWKDVRIGSK